MTSKKLIVLSSVVVVLFAFIVLFERKMPSTAERQKKGDVYWDLPQDRMDALTLVRGNETVELRKNGTSWRLVKPDSYPADTFAVDGVVGDLADLKRAGPDAEDAKPADYGLSPPAAKATIGWTDADDPKEKKTRTVEFGREVPGTDMSAARLEGSQHVMFVPTSVVTGVKKPLDDFRSKDVLAGVSPDVTKIEILRGGRGRLALAKKDGVWWLTEPLADLASPTETDRLVSRLTGVRAKEFVHGNEDLASMGLNPPLYRVTIAAGKETPASVDFGATRADGNSMYARREGQIMTVDGEVAEELSKEAEAYRSTSVVAFNRGDVTAVEASFADGTFALAQKDGGWTSQGHPVLAASADDLLSAILDLKGKSFLEEAEAKSLPPATATITIRLKAGAPWTITLHPRTGALAARASSRPGALVLDKDAATTLETAFKKAVVVPTPAPTKKAK
ncbi:MAG TPA: DUF4340 domain-containing protein [Thermoanaerobaculia bacterium]|nr:DUF4340 domain-containing protein [Thermoanaerobaculia bacterium]